jgi:hypothetical protein
LIRDLKNDPSIKHHIGIGMAKLKGVANGTYFDKRVGLKGDLHSAFAGVRFKMTKKTSEVPALPEPRTFYARCPKASPYSGELRYCSSDVAFVPKEVWRHVEYRVTVWDTYKFVAAGANAPLSYISKWTDWFLEEDIPDRWMKNLEDHGFAKQFKISASWVHHQNWNKVRPELDRVPLERPIVASNTDNCDQTV